MNELSVLKQLTALPYLPVYLRTINTAIELDLFSRLCTWVTAEELANEQGFYQEITRCILGVLYSLGFLEKDGAYYRNSEDSMRYLVKGSPEYMGTYLLFYWLGADSMAVDLKDALLHGPAALGEMSGDMAACCPLEEEPHPGCRDHEILTIARTLPEYEQIRTVLDLGCNVGMNGAQVILDRPERSGVLFDREGMLPYMQKTVEYLHLEDRTELVGGDFFTDPLKGPYDLIIASSIMCYVLENKTAFLRKLYEALAPGGIVLCVTEEVAEDYSHPWDMVLGYMPYYVHGIPAGVKKGELDQAAREAGFAGIEKREAILSCGTQTIYTFRKER